MELDLEAAPLWARVPSRPRGLPIDPPIGCARPPVEWEELDTMADVHQMYGFVVGCDEREILDRRDIVDEAAR